jgi:hypothetical protein
MQGANSASLSNFLDVASEQVACSSGVLFSDANIRRLAGLDGRTIGSPLNVLGREF